MSIRCPVCRAVNEAGPACRRCKADLSLLFALEAERDALLAAAHRDAAEGRYAAAAAEANRAHELRRGESSARLRAALRLLAGDFAGALRCYHEAGKSNDG